MEKLLKLIFISFFLNACGSENSSTAELESSENENWAPFTENATPNKSGYLLDSAVAGLRYISGHHYGVTSDEGMFHYIDGENITFYLGDIQIGYEITPKETLTPHDLAQENISVTLNILRFLQTLDDDGNPTNGIQITNDLHTSAQNRTLDFTDEGWREKQSWEQEYVEVKGKLVLVRSEIEKTVYKLTASTAAGARYLIPSYDAYEHFANTVENIASNIEAELKVLAENSNCEINEQCHKLGIMPTYQSYCQTVGVSISYSDYDMDTSAFNTKVSYREGLILIKNNLENLLNLNPNYTGSCWTFSVELHPSCNTEKKCVLTSDL